MLINNNNNNNNNNKDLEVAHPQSGSSSTWFLVELEFGNVGFWGEGKTGVPGEKPLGARERTNNKLNPHMESKPGFEPGPHWWEASTLTTAPSLAPPSTVCSLRGTDILSLWRSASTSYDLHSFNYFACKTWNSLPEKIRMESTLAGFKCLIRTISFHST